MNQNKSNKPISGRKMNAIKLEVDPNIFSVFGFVGSCGLLITTWVVEDERIVPIIAVLLLLGIIVVTEFFTRKVRKKLVSGDKAVALRERFSKYGRLVGYLGYPLFAVSVLKELYI